MDEFINFVVKNILDPLTNDVPTPILNEVPYIVTNEDAGPIVDEAEAPNVDETIAPTMCDNCWILERVFRKAEVIGEEVVVAEVAPTLEKETSGQF